MWYYNLYALMSHIMQGYADDEVYVCESRYSHKTKSFKKIKVNLSSLSLPLLLFKTCGCTIELDCWWTSA